jgi:uncharacterized peroxidase-related enzyme
MMALIDPLPAGSAPEIDDLFQLFRTVNGYEPNSLLTMQRRPAIVRPLVDLHRAIIASESRVTPELKLFVGHVASTAAGCRYCQAHTAFTAEKLGASAERIEHLWEFQTSPLFTDAERAVLTLASAAGVTPCAVTPEMRAAVREHWDDGELVEIVAIIALFGFMNRWNDTIGTPLEDQPKAFATDRLAAHGWEVGMH